MMTKNCLRLFVLASTAALSLSADAALDTNQIEQFTGLKGKWNEAEGVFKVSSPRADVKVSVDQWQMPPFMGLTSWAAFKAGMKENTMVMGDLVLFQDEVNPVMSALFESGVEVTALHNHFFYDNPKVYFMHIGGEGSVEKLAQGVKAALSKTKEIRSRKSQPDETFGRAIPAISSISAEPLQQIFTAKPEVKDGMAKFVFGRVTKMPCGCEAGKEMGVNTWAAFAGNDDNAIVDGDFACQEQELQPALRSLRQSGINIVAIHQHMTLEQPRYIFLHYWGRGKVADLANAIRLARGEQTKATAAAARETGGFQEVDAAHFNKHRSDGAVVLDVRSPEEFAKGHVPGARNIDINAPGFASKVADFDKSKPILVNCHAGSRGAIAAAELAKLGFKTICNLEGGLSAWEKAGNKAEAPATDPSLR
jgi:rhodanese-related sulfurtransferase